MAIHGVFSSYFGDAEYDVGKTTRWNQFFLDTEFVLDVGDPFRTRGYLVSWESSFPDVKYGYSSIDFFQNPAQWRKESFERADAAWGFSNNDWVAFIDCSEALSIDEYHFPLTRGDLGLTFGDLTAEASRDEIDSFYSEPSTVDSLNPFEVFLRRELPYASDDVLYLPFYALSRQSVPYVYSKVIDPALNTVLSGLLDLSIYQGLTVYEWKQLNLSRIVNALDNYVSPGWSPRIFRVSKLRDPSFNWSSIDLFVSSAPEQSTQFGLSLVSYGYAHWAADPSKVEPTTNLPETEADDTGFGLRKLISQVRPIPSLPVTWGQPDAEERTHPVLPPEWPPWSSPSHDAQFNAAFNADFRSFVRRVPQVAPTPWTSWNYITSPVYPTILRQNLRDGVFYFDRELGPVPWDALTQSPAITAEQQLVRSTQFFDRQPSPLT